MTATGPIGELEHRNVLVCVDGSESGELALSAGVTTARRNNAKVTLLAVAPLARAAAPSPVTAPPVPQGDIDAAFERTLRETVARIPQDVPVTTLLRHGRPGPEIVAAAQEEPYDAILLGARGLGRVGGLIGSVSQYVLHHATVAVFVAHAPPTAPAAPPD